MMVVGYWDANGYPDLIPGSNLVSTNVYPLLASPEHVADYALYNNIDDSNYTLYPNPYPDKSTLGGAHTSNCLADFMYTSWSSHGNHYGETTIDQIAAGTVRYAAWRNSSYVFTGNDIWMSQPTWAAFTKEIQYGRPVVLDVDTNGSGAINHSVAAIGYRNTNGYNEYLCHDTYGNEVWYKWQPTGNAWGIGGMSTLRPASTSDSTWKGSSGGAWSTTGNWSGGVPTSSTFVWLPSSAQVTVSSSGSARLLQVQGGLNVQSRMDFTDLRLVDGGSVTLTSGTPRVNVTAGFLSDGAITQSTGTVAASGDVNFGNATYTQSGGTNTVGGSFSLGWAGATVSTYTLSGGSLSVTGSESVGNAGSGACSFAQSAGVHTVGGLLDVRGTYGLTGGSLTAGQLAVEAGGRLAVTPGSSAATTHFGSVTFSSTSTYATRISGTTAGSQYGQLTATGAVSLSGATLDLTLAYDPHIGDSYTLVSKGAGSPASGTFAGLGEGTLFERQNSTSLKSFLLQVTYAGGSGSDVTVQDVTTVGDGNHDGYVDGLDYGIWQNGYGKPNPTFWMGDYNLDGVVDGLDYGAWQNNYSYSLLQSDAFAMAPEPASLSLLLLGILPLLRRRRR
jgi:hypothetical protein